VPHHLALRSHSSRSRVESSSQTPKLGYRSHTKQRKTLLQLWNRWLKIKIK
jgi:hypothetical protein